MTDNKEKKNILVIGATDGVGLQVVHYILKETHHNLSVVCRNKKKLEDVLKDEISRIK